MASQSLIQISDLLENYSIVFDQDIPDRLKCIICDHILINAKQTTCGCKVCEKCINTYLKGGEMSCPSKQKDCAETKLILNRGIFQDNATNREISNLKAKCPFNSCIVKESLKVLLIHIDSCEHREITSDKYSKKYPHKNKSKRNQSECDERMISCIHCQKSIMAQILIDAHLNVDHEDFCSEYIGDCNIGCGEKAVNLKNHLRNCKNKKVDCPFLPLQCTIGKLTTEDLKKHLSVEMVPHFSTLVTELKSNKTSTEDVKELQSLCNDHMKTIKKLTDSQQKTGRAIEDLKTKGPEGATASQAKNVVFRKGSFIWKITDYESLKYDAKYNDKAYIESESFYTSEFGYKICLIIFPLGDGVGRGTHLSVYFAIMKGDYDDILSWPFKQKVTLSLLDQENNGTNNHSVTFKPDTLSACNQKPVDDCNNSSGLPEFISLNSLIPNTIYYKNNNMYLKIAVDTTGISRP